MLDDNKTKEIFEEILKEAEQYEEEFEDVDFSYLDGETKENK